MIIYWNIFITKLMQISYGLGAGDVFMRFTKMHGCGNDYIYVNCFEENVEKPNEVSKVVSERHFGIGADGLFCPTVT